MTRVTVLALFASLVFLSGELAFAQKTALLKVKDISVQTTNPQEKSWDAFGGAPDPIVHVKHQRIFGRKITVRGVEDRYKGAYPVKKQKPFLVEVGDRVRFQVYDEDPGPDDFIGAVTITITAEDLRKGSRQLNKFGRVKTLTIEFSK